MISGKEFKSQYPGLKYYKLTTDDENHNGYQFKDGLNIDTNPINTNKCSQGGLYFTEGKKIYKWLSYNNKIMKYIREVEILDDSIICIEEDKYKTDKFVLKSRKIIFEDEEICKLIVKEYGLALYYVKTQTEEICKLSVEKDGLALEYVKDQTYEICKIAVKQYGLALKYVSDQTEELCKIAVEQDGYALKYVKTQTEEICKIAVEEDGYALEYVKDQTEKMCKLAIQKYGTFDRLIFYMIKKCCFNNKN